MTDVTKRTLYNDMAVTVPEGQNGECEISRFEVEGNELASLRYAMSGRGCKPGAYTRLDQRGRLWMSDTTAERRDHIEPAYRMKHYGGRVLVGGLGLGMIVNCGLLQEKVSHIDVVEINADVIALVGPHYIEMAKTQGKTLAIHHEDIFAIKWKPGTRWNVAWFDVWGDISTDDKESMSKLRRSYGRRADWTGCWGQNLLRGR